MFVINNCKICNKEFPVSPSRVKKGEGAYCSRICAGKGLLKFRKVKVKIPFEDRSKLDVLAKTKTLQEIGEIYGVSRERIRQILKSQGLGVKKFRKKILVKCVEEDCPNTFKRRPIRGGRNLCVRCYLYRRKIKAGESPKRFIGTYTHCQICKKELVKKGARKPGKYSGICGNCRSIGYRKK